MKSLILVPTFAYYLNSKKKDFHTLNVRAKPIESPLSNLSFSLLELEAHSAVTDLLELAVGSVTGRD